MTGSQRRSRAGTTARRVQVSIAADLGISRFKVARLLEWARSEGIVRIEVAEPKSTWRCQGPGQRPGIERALVLDTATRTRGPRR